MSGASESVLVLEDGGIFRGEGFGVESDLEKAIRAAPGQPILIDRFLDDSYEVDVDALGDGQQVLMGAMMQHIEEAGVHSGDSACGLPPYKISDYHMDVMRDFTEHLGLALARIAAQVMAGVSMDTPGVTSEPRMDGFLSKEPCCPSISCPAPTRAWAPRCTRPAR